MPDYLGLAQQQDQNNQVTTTDIFGLKSPLSLAGQPALPQGGPAAAGTAAAAPTAGGTGVATPATPQGPGPGFGDLAAGALPTGGGSGEAGPGEASAVGQGGLPSASTEVGGLTFSGSPFGASVRGPGGLGISAGPTGSVGLSTGNVALDSALGFAAKSLGIPLGVNAITGLASLASGPAASILGAALGPAAVPFGLVALAHQFATTQDFSVTNMQNALQQVNPEFHLTPAQAQQIAQYGAQAFAGPVVGGPQPIGALAIDNPVTNVNATTQAGPAGATLSHAPGQTFSEALAESLTPTPTFAALANAMGFGREDMSGPSGPGPAGTGTGTGAGTGTGDVSTGGDPGGSPY